MDKEKSKKILFGKLGKKLFLFSGIIVFVSLVVMIIQGVHCSHRAVQSAAHEYLQSILECKEEHLEQWLNERIADIKTLSNTGCLTDCLISNKTSFCSVIYFTKKRCKTYQAIAIFDIQKKQIFTTDNQYDNFNLSMVLKQPLFKETYLFCEKVPEITIAYFVEKKFIIVSRLDLTDVLQEIAHHKIGPTNQDKL